MAAIVLDGKSLAQQLEKELAVRVQRIREMSAGKPPILATILVGDDRNRSQSGESFWVN
jgi:methylenetetrahydrofolate dehydrogenase (NADP+)/methenyltetrahydrofolate cyclohydrolase